MSKYIKSNTTYTLRKKSQNVTDGVIYERDWSTLEGQKLRFGKGKTPIYTDGNFVFTTANIRMPSRRSKPNTTEEKYTYDDVKDAKSYVNNVELNAFSNDVRNFAYYGSCVNLIETSINNIISNFPACMYSNGSKLEYLNKENEENPIFEFITDENNNLLYIIENPFEIDLLTKSIDEKEVYNVYRFLCETYDKYELNGVTVSGYNVDYKFSDCKDDDQWYNFKIYREINKRIAPIVITFYFDNKSPVEIIGYRYNDDIVFLTTKEDFILKPKEEVINEYFDKLKGFEKQLLTQHTKPLYTNTFLTPVDNMQDGYNYVNKKYTWPTVRDYCLDITSPNYVTFIRELLSMASIYDETWTNNLYNRMTHEAIKNFDWTYTQDYVDGEEQDNIDGGQRMQQILFLIGRVFDDIKSYINGIKNSNNVTYDGLMNIPDALLSDKAEVLGWDITSVIPSKEVITLNKDFIDNNHLNWFNSVATDKYNSTLLDVNFMRNLILSSKRILSSKGTQESIDMVMGLFGFGRNNVDFDDDYEINEKYYVATLNSKISKKTIDNLNVDRISYSDPYYQETFNGLPLDILNIKGTEYVIPFFDKNKDYNHELYFQSKGGWGCYPNKITIKDENNKDVIIDADNYCETVSYLNVVSTFGALQETSSLDVSKDDIYYVVDLTDYPLYSELTEEEKKDVSHFFYYDGISTSLSDSWKNIEQSKIIENSSDKNGKKAYYLNSIVNTKFGNNPHVGFGLYDNGKSFKEFMNQPFKYFVDNNDFINDDSSKEAEKISFDISEEDGNKFVTFNQLKEGLNNNNYLLNTKIVTIKNNIVNQFYKTYFRNHILPYLMQVIPSTTILILEGF